MTELKDSFLYKHCRGFLIYTKSTLTEYCRENKVNDETKEKLQKLLEKDVMVPRKKVR